MDADLPNIRVKIKTPDQKPKKIPPDNPIILTFLFTHIYRLIST